MFKFFCIGMDELRMNEHASCGSDVPVPMGYHFYTGETVRLVTDGLLKGLTGTIRDAPRDGRLLIAPPALADCGVLLEIGGDAVAAIGQPTGRRSGLAAIPGTSFADDW